jgi:RNA polymerase sigma-70 factor (ECF subfamily)
MVRLALGYVRSRAVAEEVAQEAWLALLRGLDGFEGRSSLRTWLYRIVVNQAISAGVRERVHLPVDDGELEDDNGRFSQDGWWVTPPTPWADEVVDRIAAGDVAARIRALIAELPPAQRQVVTLRDVEGLKSAEVCAILGITDGNQRVLLHRARARIRARLEEEVAP